MPTEKFNPISPTPRSVEKEHTKLIAEHQNSANERSTLQEKIDSEIGFAEGSYSSNEHQIEKYENALRLAGEINPDDEEGEVGTFTKLLKITDTEMEVGNTVYIVGAEKFYKDHPEIIDALKNVPSVYGYRDWSDKYEEIADSEGKAWKSKGEYGDIVRSVAVEVLNPNGKFMGSPLEVLRNYNAVTKEKLLDITDAKALEDLVSKLRPDGGGYTDYTKLQSLILSSEDLAPVHGEMSEIIARYTLVIQQRLGGATARENGLEDGLQIALARRDIELKKAIYDEEDALAAARRHAERYMGELRSAALAEAALDGVQINTDDAIKLK